MHLTLVLTGPVYTDGPAEYAARIGGSGGYIEYANNTMDTKAAENDQEEANDW